MANNACPESTPCKDREVCTRHRVIFSDSRNLTDVPDASVDLVVTSPPYPMVEMWDSTFSDLNLFIADALSAADGLLAFELMHRELDKVWQHCYRVLKPGSIACINVGDAVRTMNSSFRIYSNHARILSSMSALGFQTLPDVLWRKQTNAPNKFMGSGMLPAGAYVTYEHEYVLIFRKGARREFKTRDEKENRQASAFFWEERNSWFSDVWFDLKGTSQQLCDQSARARSGAFPLELALRLICMHSVYGDLVLDPFLGTGTTTAATIAAGRNSTGIDLRGDLRAMILATAANAIGEGVARVKARLLSHRAFVESRLETGHRFKYHNHVHDIPVMTSQEVGLTLYLPERVRKHSEMDFEVAYRQMETRDLLAQEQLQIFKTS